MTEQQPPAPKAPDENVAVTAAKGVAAITKLFDVLGKAAIALFMMFMERAKIKQEKAEDKQAKAESDLKIVQKSVEIDKAADAKSDSEIIGDFLSERGAGTSSKGTKP